MRTRRSFHVHRLLLHGGIIFGLSGTYFEAGFDRSTSNECMDLLGVKDTPKGKRYPILPPILYPEGSRNDPKKLFLSPAITRVCFGMYLRVHCTLTLHPDT